MIPSQLLFVLSCVALVAVVVLRTLATDSADTTFMAGLVMISLISGVWQLLGKKQQAFDARNKRALAKMYNVFSIPVWALAVLIATKPPIWVWAIACIACLVTAVVVARRWAVLAPSVREQLRARGLR